MYECDANWQAALAGFEESPWRWQVADARASNIPVYFLWRWRDVLQAGYMYEVTTQRLHHLLARGDVPAPGSLHLRDRAMQAALEAYAGGLRSKPVPSHGLPMQIFGRADRRQAQAGPFAMGCRHG